MVTIQSEVPLGQLEQPSAQAYTSVLSSAVGLCIACVKGVYLSRGRPVICAAPRSRRQDSGKPRKPKNGECVVRVWTGTRGWLEPAVVGPASTGSTPESVDPSSLGAALGPQSPPPIAQRGDWAGSRDPGRPVTARGDFSTGPEPFWAAVRLQSRVCPRWCGDHLEGHQEQL